MVVDTEVVVVDTEEVVVVVDTEVALALVVDMGIAVRVDMVDAEEEIIPTTHPLEVVCLVSAAKTLMITVKSVLAQKAAVEGVVEMAVGSGYQ